MPPGQQACEVIAAYQKCVAATVQRFGGFVAKYMGDGVLVYFCYPQAQTRMRGR
jgi:class 3 adenylate cyclase